MARDRGRHGGRREDYGSEDFRNRERRSGYGSGQDWGYGQQSGQDFSERQRYGGNERRSGYGSGEDWRSGQQSGQGFSGRQQYGESGWGGSDYEDRGYGQRGRQADWPRRGMGGWGGSDYEDRGYGQMSGQDEWSRRGMGGGMGASPGPGGYGSYYGSRDPYGGSSYGRGYEGDFRGQSYAREYGGGGQMGGGMRGQMGGRYGGGERGYAEGGRYGGSERGYGESGGRDLWDRAGDELASWFGDEEAAQRRRQDQHRGRGPRGYRRSDERIKEDINDRLTDDWMLDASDIEVTVQSCEVILSGEVASREDKRRAEDIAEAVSGVNNVQNNLRIRQQGAQSGIGTSGMGTSSATGTSGSTVTASTSESGSKTSRKT